MTWFVRSTIDSAKNVHPARRIRPAALLNRNPSLQRRRLSFEVLERRALLTVTTTITVNDPLDESDNPTNATPASLGSTVSLRDAVNAANNSLTPTNIVFDPTVFSGSKTITLVQGPLTLNNTTEFITITGPGTTLLISGNNATTVFTVNNGTTATISDLAIGNGDSEFDGGGIVNDGTLTLDTTTIENNACGFFGNGGGIYSDGTLTVDNSTIEGNTATYGIGGGIFCYGSITVENSTFVNNSVPNGGQGGGIALFNQSSSGLFENCTFTENSAPGSWGGAIWIYGPTVTLDDCTFDGNTAANGPGIGSTFTSEASPVLNNCIMADAVDLYQNITFSTQSANNLLGPGASGGLTAGNSSGNIFESSIAAMDLGTLSNKGGPTETIPLLAGSPAIGAGSTSLIPPGMTTDQRGAGFPRIVNGTVDIGAFEVQPPPECDLSISRITDSATTLAGGTVEYTISVSNSGPSAAENVSILDTLPGGTTFGSQSQPAGQGFALSNTGNQIDDTIASLAAGAY